MRRLSAVLLALVLAQTACDDLSYREIGAAINVLTQDQEEPHARAIGRLRKFGRRAIPQIETAMHTTSPEGKINLVAALAAIGDPDATAILQHFATYDASPEVRSACEDLLKRWAAGNDRRSQPAQQALARVYEKRALGWAE